MELRSSRIAWAAAACLLGIALLAGCSHEGAPPPSAPPHPLTAAPPQSQGAGPKLRAAVVTDVGGIGDKSFNMMAWNGLQRAGKELGFEVKAAESREDADYEPNLRRMAGQGFDVVVGVGYKLKDPMAKVAPDYPKVKFVLVDEEVPGAPNVLGLKFREEEGSFLVGALAGGMTKKNQCGFIGGQQIPLIEKFEAGYKAGVKTTDPKADFLVKYTQSWEDVARGKELATIEFGQGADVIFHASGKCGLGVIAAAKERGPGSWAIGVDADQDYLGTADPEHPQPPSRVLTSMVKHVDTAVFGACEDVKNGRFKAGTRVLGLKEGGVDMSPLTYTKGDIPPALLQRVEALKQQVISGKIKVPATLKALEQFHAPVIASAK